MEIYKGIGVSQGVSIYRAAVIDAEDYRIPKRVVPKREIANEVKRLRKAFLDATQEMNTLQSSQADASDGHIKDIFAVHLHFLRDRTLRKNITDIISEKQYSAEYAVSVVMRDIARHFNHTPDRYISERANDIFDIEKRIVRHLIGDKREDLKHLTAPVVVIARDLTPTETASFDKTYIKGLATDAGGRTSHTAIVARSMGIPAVVALGDLSQHVTQGDMIIVDGNRGTVIVDPDEETIKEYRSYAAEFLNNEILLNELAELPAVTTDFEPIELLGNIEFPEESTMVLQRGGDGVGLYRTEFLFLDVSEEPSEEDHFNAYMKAIELMGNRSITIRTVDLGADKFTQARSGEPERNPFLGLRSIRYCLQHVPMFKAQLRAILRASAFGKVKMMFPLITSMVELRQAKWIVADVKEDLEEQGIAFDENMPVGIMIETPASALIADDLAQEVDFFSIGTNDLIQYTLAVDRVNERVASLYNPMHPAVLQLLSSVAKSAKRAKIDVSICGEMASEPEVTPLLLGMGFRTLSLAPPMIPEVKKVIRSVSVEYCRRMARKVLAFDTESQTVNFIREEFRKINEGKLTE